METKMTSIDRKDVDDLIGKDWEYFHFPIIGLSGGILVLWNMKVVTFVVKETSSQMIVGDLSVPNLGIWKVGTVYGSRCCKGRESLWSQLGSCMEDSIPSIIGGEFNCVLNKEEKRGGKRFLFSKGPKDMKCFMTNFDFHDVGNIGPRFTWCNNKEGASRIWERLDRCILNSAALQKLPIAVFRHLARVASDHSPIAFKMDESVRIKSKTIKFEDTWKSYPAAKSIVYHSWKKNDFGAEGMILQRKINRTLKELYFWCKNKCKDLNMLKEKLKIKIVDLQNKEAVGVDWTAEDLSLLRSKIHELNVTLRRSSTWWNQRAKSRWHEEGDINSKLFHSFATVRRNGNRVNQIKDMHNEMQIEDDQIEKIFIQYFEAKWKSRECELSGWPVIYDNQKLNLEEAAALNEEFSVNELQQSVFQQGSNRSLGLDGLTSSFYRCYWNIVWEDLWNAIKFFLVSGCMRKDWKDTLIDIAKVKNPLIPSNYRPISLCQTNYKIAATILVNILKNYIPKLITEEQMAFIPGRSISKHCLLAQEIFYKLKISKSKKGLMALKLDMEQTYDSMGWLTLGQILKWINANKLQVIFGKAVRCPMKKKIAKVFGFKVVKEISYLGIKISLDRLKMVDFQELLSNVMDRLNAWGKKSLCMRGKITLITSSLFSMPNILITHSLVPKRVLYALEKLYRSFIWHKPDGSRSIHYVAWGDFCKLRSMGELGLQSPVMKSSSLRSKLAWNFMLKPETLFHRKIKAKYGNNVMNGTQKKATSMAWQVLVDGGRHLKSIIRWKVGVGDEINVLNDVWILDKCLNRWPTFVDCDSLDGVYVQQLILEGGHWNHSLLQEFFHPDLIILINQIQIDSGTEDRVELQSLCSGKIVSALSYEHMVRCKFNIEDDGYCNWLQKLKLNKKVEMF
ncbi:hypothetical protein KFK09_019384 [Dendrobium nobile]|uniref:Reverse transcriptase domain-containing protein n=1 Tax=Dendrobium nobile TaxID=94219 RepID=A0A8T3APD0_DENNO|nr:hypothetical protein KFK09_019384 [Dendrobium nobile]